MTAKEIIDSLRLLPHPEGGYFRETYRSTEKIFTRADHSLNICTAIYYLLEEHDRSHFHRIKSDELWYFHQGEPLEILVIDNNELKSIHLGNDLAAGQLPQAMVPANCWFASHVKDEIGYSLVSCSVAPGFDFADFEMANGQQLTEAFPHLSATIKKFTKP